jgi:hypothetical protein
MSEKGTSLARFVEHFGLEILNKGDTYDTDRIESTNINRPDLQILGLFDYFDARRIQVMGKAELTYIMKRAEPRCLTICSPIRFRPSFWRATLNAHRSVWNMLKITAGRFFGQRSGLRISPVMLWNISAKSWPPALRGTVFCWTFTARVL